VDTQSVETASTFNQQLLQDIPAGRDPWSTVAQMPGATLSTFDVGGNQSMQQSTMQVHAAHRVSRFSVSTVWIELAGREWRLHSVLYQSYSFQEFQVVSDNTPGSVSISGIYMNMVTKSGSNSVHGGAAAYYGTDAFQADPKFPTFNGSPVVAGSPTVMVRDTTASWRPLIKDRSWLFGSDRRYTCVQL